MNKREFVVAAGGALACGTGWAMPSSAGPRAESLRGDGERGAAAWRAALGQRYELLGAGPALTLTRVDARAADARFEQFTLVFAQADGADAMLQPGSHILRGEDGRLVALYLDDAGCAEAGTALLRADCTQAA